LRKVVRTIAVILYYGFARYLPVSFSPISFGLTKPIRGVLCRFIFKKCGRNVNVERGALFGYNIEIGDNSGIGINAQLSTGGGIRIGNNVLMAPDVIILTENHKIDDVTIPIIKTGSKSAPVVIEDDVWIGTRVIILPGVTIGRSSIIGAGAVVSKSIPPYSIAAGVPARVIKKRKEN
jgi:maltose O-acetyltransferase